jgi:hypothetical protein
VHDDCDLVLTFDLDGHWNDGNAVAALVMFSKVRNRDAVLEFLRTLREVAGETEALADVVAIVRSDEGSFLVDTSRGALSVEASRFSEI